MSAMFETKQTLTGIEIIGRTRGYGEPAVSIATIDKGADDSFSISLAEGVDLNIADEDGLFDATGLEGALAEVKTLADAGMTVQKRTVTIGHADLTDADTSQTINIGAALPANARIIGVDMHSGTVFAGGTVSQLLCDVGTSGDVDALIDGADLDTALVDGGPSSMPPGIRPNKTFVDAGAQLTATIVSTGDNLVNLTSGAITIDVLFAVLA